MARPHGRLGMTNLSYSRNYFKITIGLMVSFTALFYFVNSIDFQKLTSEIKQFDTRYLVYGLISLLIGYVIRIYRWSFILSKTNKLIKFKDCISPFMGSIALNNTLPLRAGDILRVLVFPHAMGISKTQSLGSIVIERLFDVLILITILFIFLPHSFNEISSIVNFPELNLIYIYIFTGIFLLILLRMIPVIYRSIKNFVINFFIQNSYMMAPKKVLLVLVCSVLIWIAEGGLFFFILLGLDINIGFFVSLYLMAIVTLGTLIPSSPGYIGTFHFIAYSGLFFLIEDSSIAASFAVISHAALWLSTTATGMILIFWNINLFESFKLHWKNK